MTTTAPSRPLIAPGWLRVLVFCVVHLLLILTGVWLMTLFIHHTRGETVNAIGLMKTELLWAVIGLSFVGSLAVTYSFRHWVDRKSFPSLGLLPGNRSSDLIAGGSLAFAMLGIATLILRLTGHLKWTDIVFDGRALLIALVNLLLVAIYEEILFRGYMLSNLLESFRPWMAIAVSAFLFTLFHVGNPGFDFFSVVNLFAIGLLLGLCYLHTRSLWFPIGFHFIWNFLEGPVLGFPVSGIHFDSLLQPEMKGDQNITGAGFGLEGSAIVMAVCVAAIVVVYSMMQKKPGRR
jgi:membrane protease YdiL (CAAX protease family)